MFEDESTYLKHLRRKNLQPSDVKILSGKEKEDLHLPECLFYFSVHDSHSFMDKNEYESVDFSNRVDFIKSIKDGMFDKQNWHAVKRIHKNKYAITKMYYFPCE